MRKLFASTLLLLSLSFTSIARAQYTAVDLNPSANLASSSAAAAGGQQGGQIWDSATPFSPTTHAAVWNGSSTAFSDLHPAGLAGSSAVNGMSGNMQVGIANRGAAMWSGSAASYVSLHPLNYAFSQAFGAAPGVQVGCGNAWIIDKRTGATVPDQSHALLWFGSNAGFVDLNIGTGFDSSCATAAAGSQQVGYAVKAFTPKAVMWNGTAKSIISLHPLRTYSTSQALATDGIQQVGIGSFVVKIEKLQIGRTYGLVWNGTAASFRELFPPAGWTDSYALGVGGGKQVGFAFNGQVFPNPMHAVVWNPDGTTVDLHQFLPANFVSSKATSIDPITGVISGVATSDPTDSTKSHAIAWVPLP